MSKKTVTACDCGCGKTDEGKCFRWFTLKRKRGASASSDGSRVEIESPLHFLSLECLSTWASKAAMRAKEMEEYLKSDDFEGGHLNGYMLRKDNEDDESMRKLVVPIR